MTIGSIRPTPTASLIQQAQAIRPSNDGDADDKGAVASSATSAPRVNDGDADDAVRTARARVPGPAQAALLQLQSGE
ncbi:MAG: hypothetical protein WC807_15965 [Hyphomicrobium sp.]|jgi:hypothetical protein